MHYGRHRLTASVVYVSRPMTNELALFDRWSVRQKLNRVSSVQLRRFVRALKSAARSYLDLLHAGALSISFV